MRREEHKEFDGLRFRMLQLNPFKAARAAARVGRVFAPALARLATGKQLDEQVSVDALSDAIGALFDKLSPDEMEGILRDLLAETDVEVSGKNGQVAYVALLPVLDVQLAGRLGVLFQLARWSMELNDFFGAVGKLFAGLQNPTAAVLGSSSPPS